MTDLALRKWRWRPEFGFFRDGFHIGFHHEVLFHNANKWQRAARYFSISLTKHWLWGQSHDYYDGPHCGFSLGFLHINWSWNWCTKCMPDEEGGG